MGSNSHNLHIWRGNVWCLLCWLCSGCLTSGFIGKFILQRVVSLTGQHNTCEKRSHLRICSKKSYSSCIITFYSRLSIPVIWCKGTPWVSLSFTYKCSFIVFKQLSEGGGATSLGHSKWVIWSDAWVSALVTKISYESNSVVWPYMYELKILRSRVLLIRI